MYQGTTRGNTRKHRIGRGAKDTLEEFKSIKTTTQTQGKRGKPTESDAEDTHIRRVLVNDTIRLGSDKCHDNKKQGLADQH